MSRRFLLGSLLLVFPAILFAQIAASDIVINQWNGSDFVERDVSPAASGFLTFDGSKVPVSTTDLTYATPTLNVPDAFNLSSAGSISLTAGDTAKSISLIPSTTGGVGIGTVGVTNTRLLVFANSVSTTPTFSTWFPINPQAVFFSEGDTGTKDFALASASSVGSSGSLVFKTSSGTLASPATISSAQNIGAIASQAYDGGSFRTTASIDFATTTAVTSGVAPQQIIFKTGQTTSRSDRVSIRPTGSLRIGLTGESAPAWATDGIIASFQSGTWTDTTSTGSPTTIAFTTFGRPTLAATNSITPVNLTTVYIDNSPANGSNVTAAAQYSLYINAGNSKFNGSLLLSGGNIRTQRILLSRAASGSEPTDNSFSVTTNEGATTRVDRTLPAASAGLTYTYIVQDSDGLRIIANTGNTIRMGGTVTSSAGSITSTTIGDSVTLVAINTTQWIAISYVGTPAGSWTFI